MKVSIEPKPVEGMFQPGTLVREKTNPSHIILVSNGALDRVFSGTVISWDDENYISCHCGGWIKDQFTLFDDIIILEND